MEIAGALPGASPVTGELSERDRAILAFERQWWKFAGAKEQAIRELFDMSATRYYQVLNALLDRPEALAADPPGGGPLRGAGSPARRRAVAHGHPDTAAGAEAPRHGPQQLPPAAPRQARRR